MKIGRRGFLKLASGLAIASIAAPAFIPADRLDFGVPRPKLIVPEPPQLLLGRLHGFDIIGSPEVGEAFREGIKSRAMLDGEMAVVTIPSEAQWERVPTLYHTAQTWDDRNALKQLRRYTLRDERGREYPVVVEPGMPELSYEHFLQARRHLRDAVGLA